GAELHRAVARERRGLHAQVARGLEVREDREVVLLALVLVDPGRVEVGDTGDREARRDAGAGRDLEVPDEASDHRADLAGRVEQGLEVPEAVPLTGLVVDRAAGRRGGDADAVLEVVAGDEVGEATDAAPVLRARLEPRLAPAVHGNVAALVERAALGL